MLDNIITQLSKHTDISKLFQVQRAGKDKDETFWSFGKIHGLENLAFADPAELEATKGNPVKIQLLVDRLGDENHSQTQKYSSEESLVAEMHTALADYK
jgi:hypothetical protein